LGTLVHEVLHCVLKHITRLRGLNPLLWNIADDYVVNLMVLESGFALDGDPIALSDIGSGKIGYLYDPQFTGMGAEQVYGILQKTMPTVTVTLTTGEMREGPASNSPQIEAAWENAIHTAAGVYKRSNAGNIPGHFRRLLEAFEKPRIDWREQTKDFIADSCTKDFSWSRPNRRSLTCGVLLPGYAPDAMQHLVFVIDCSGSITNTELSQMGAEGQAALDAGLCDKLTVAYTDTMVQKTEEYLPGDRIKLNSPGGGGTCFNSVMDWIPENCPDASAIIFMTDMATNSFGKDPYIPVLWGSITPVSQLQTRPNFGRIIQVCN